MTESRMPTARRQRPRAADRALRRLGPSLRPLIGTVPMGVLLAVSRYEPEDQPQVLVALRPFGARGAKRYVESLINPPDREDVARRIRAFARREFPTFGPAELAAGAAPAALSLRAGASGKPS